ncbi:MAG: sulfotransferase [Verrucomicrobia bacterium]|nr:sulfotransferase [Verrucomicrobiota bacterium]
MRPGALPNLIIIGAQKCGTTSLHFYLGLHPEIFMSRRKEMDFFSDDRNWEKGAGWYARHFDGRYRWRGEASPFYTTYPRMPDCPRRMHSLIPDARLIYMVRDPLERIVSHYIHNLDAGIERREFAEAVRQDPFYCDVSRYGLQLGRYLEFYPRDRILVATAERLLTDRAAVLESIFRFLGVDAGFASARFRLRLHQSAFKRRLTRFISSGKDIPGSSVFGKISPHVAALYRKIARYPFSARIERPEFDGCTKEFLRDQLAEDIARFRKMTGLDLAHWKV